MTITTHHWLIGELSPDGEPMDDPANCPVSKHGIFALLSYEEPVSTQDPSRHWLRIDEQIDGVICGQMRANILPLQVGEDRLIGVLEATDWVGGESGWRHDLSWHNTGLSTPEDPTVQGYVQALASVGLAWTFGRASHPNGAVYGWCLAQGAYPLDLTPENWRALGLSGSIDEALGEPADTARHALVLITPGDD